MPDAPFQVSLAAEADRLPLAVIFAAISAERDGIATQPPVDIGVSSVTLPGCRPKPSRG